VEGLKAILKSRTNIQSVWLNENNEWLFSPAKGMREVSREEILNEQAAIEETSEEVPEIEVPIVEETKATKKRVKKNKK
jgi:hypothetical protein